MPGPHGGYTLQELIDAGGVVYHPPGNPDITIVYYQPPGTTARTDEIEFTQNPNTQEFHPKAGDNETRYEAMMAGQGNGQAPGSGPTSTTQAANAPTTPPTSPTTASESQTDRTFSASANGANGQYDANTEQWRSLVAQYFQPQDVDKALWVIQHESGGNPGVYGDAGHSVGLFQLNDRGLASGRDLKSLEDPATNIRLAAQAVYGPQGWKPWGEGATYNGQAFGALGNFPYPGDASQGSTAKQDVAASQQPAAPPPPPPPLPSPIGSLPAKQFPGFTSSATGQRSSPFTPDAQGNIPVYGGPNVSDQTASSPRQGGLLTLASRSPGAVSLVSPQGGLGYNPYAIQSGQAGENALSPRDAALASFGIPFASFNPYDESRSGPNITAQENSFLNQYLDNPYSADNPVEQARLAGVLVGSTPEVTNGYDESALTMGAGGAAVKYRRGGRANTGGLALNPVVQQEEAPPYPMGAPVMMAAGDTITTPGLGFSAWIPRTPTPTPSEPAPVATTPTPTPTPVATQPAPPAPTTTTQAPATTATTPTGGLTAATPTQPAPSQAFSTWAANPPPVNTSEPTPSSVFTYTPPPVNPVETPPPGAPNPVGGLLRAALVALGQGNPLAFLSAVTGTPMHLASGGGLRIMRPATIVDNATGRPLATLSEVRPEQMFDHGGYVTVENHVPGTQRYAPPGANRIATLPHADFGDSFQTNLDTTGTTGTATPVTGGAGFGGEPVTNSTGTAPATTDTSGAAASTSTTPAGGLASSSLPTPTVPSPGAPGTLTAPAPTTNAPATSPAGSPNTLASLLGMGPGPSLAPMPNIDDYTGGGQYNAHDPVTGAPDSSRLPPELKYAYDTAVKNWMSAADNADAQLQLQDAQATQKVMDALFNSDTAAAVARNGDIQRQRDALQPLYGKYGVTAPTEITPPYALPGSPPPTTPLRPGLQWALLSPEQQFAQIYQPLKDYFQNLRDTISAQKAVGAGLLPPAPSQATEIANAVAKAVGGTGGGGYRPYVPFGAAEGVKV